jgi:hypothetical protein
MKTQARLFAGLLLACFLAGPSTASAGVVLSYLGQHAGSATSVALYNGGSSPIDSFNTSQGGPFEWRMTAGSLPAEVTSLVDHYPSTPTVVNQFTTFCIEAVEFLSSGSDYDVLLDNDLQFKPILNAPYGPMGQTAANLLRTLWAQRIGEVFSDADPTGVKRSAFQLAIWELVYDGGATINLGSGNLRASGPSSPTSVIGLASDWLNGAITAPVSQEKANLIVFSYKGRQDQVGEYVPPPHQNSPLPEPGTFAIWGALLLGAFGVVRLRRS